MRWLPGLFIVLGAPLGALAIYAAAVFGTGNFHAVVAGEAYRSAQPDAAAIHRYSQDHQIRAIINLRGANPDAAWYREEVATARRLNIRHIDFRMSAKENLTPEEAARLIAVMADAPKPFLVHCQSGADRTGLASALYLAAVKKAGEAAAEAQLSLLYGHVAAPFAKGWAMTTTFERLEPAMGFADS